MHSKSDNTEIMISDEADEVIKNLFDSLKNRYQNNLQSMRGSEFVFDYVQLLYYKCHKINVTRGESYINSPYWIKNKKTTINPINKKDNKSFQYAVTVALNYEEIKKDLQRITKIKPFVNKYNWEGINFPLEKDDWEKFEKNNVIIALNVLYAKKEKVYPGNVSWLSPLLRGITSKHDGDFYCLYCFHSLRTKNKLESHKRAFENKDFCNVNMPSEDTKILEFNQYQKSDKAPFIVYADLECIIEKTAGCKNNPESLSTKKVSEQIPSGFSVSTISSFRSIENKHDIHRVNIAGKSFVNS